MTAPQTPVQRARQAAAQRVPGANEFQVSLSGLRLPDTLRDTLLQCVSAAQDMGPDFPTRPDVQFAQTLCLDLALLADAAREQPLDEATARFLRLFAIATHQLRDAYTARLNKHQERAAA